jgi:hypothetical protein
LAPTPLAIDTLMPITSGMAATGVLSSRALAAAAAMVPTALVACQPAVLAMCEFARAKRAATSKPTTNAAMVSVGVARVLSASGSSAGMSGATICPIMNVKS